MKYEQSQRHSLTIEPRAGLVPYFTDANGVTKFLFMVSSNPRFGGPRPMVSKGKIEPDESPFDAAVREAEEELGFVKSNAAALSHLIGDEHVHLRSTNYHLTMYAVEVSSPYDFIRWGEETKYTTWLTAEEFRRIGRADHHIYIARIETHLKNKNA